MPEIPDLNIFASNLSKKLIGKNLLNISIPITRKLKQPEADFKTAIVEIALGCLKVGLEVRLILHGKNALADWQGYNVGVYYGGLVSLFIIIHHISYDQFNRGLQYC
jgi:hypothetical protein